MDPDLRADLPGAALALIMSSERSSLPTTRSIGKWVGLFAGVAAWVADQQIVAATVYARCPPRSTLFVLVVGIACFSLAVGGGLISWWVRSGLPSAETASASARTDRFIATLSIFMAAISALAIVFGTTAGFLLRCERF
jgi:hypothetical protein